MRNEELHGGESLDTGVATNLCPLCNVFTNEEDCVGALKPLHGGESLEM